MASGCQQFSVLGEFKLTTSNTDTTDALTLDIEKTRALQYEPIELTPSGGTPPYYYSVADNDLYYLDPWNDIGTFSGNSFIPAASVGKVDIILKDSLNRSVRKELIIRPPSPAIVQPGIGEDVVTVDSIVIEWTIDDSADQEDMISSFIITRTNESNVKTEISVSNSERNYVDSGLGNGTYRYYITSKAQANNYYMSISSDEIEITVAVP